MIDTLIPILLWLTTPVFYSDVGWYHNRHTIGPFQTMEEAMNGASTTLLNARMVVNQNQPYRSDQIEEGDKIEVIKTLPVYTVKTHRFRFEGSTWKLTPLERQWP